MKVNDYLLIIYPALWLFLTFYKSVLYKGNDFSPLMWSRKQVKLLQGVSCIGVILHHLTQMITSYGSVKHGPITIFSSMGILFTSIFFFSTGFGLITSVYNNPDYLKNFLRHRLSIVLIPFFTANTIYVLLRIYYKGLAMSKMDIARSVLGLVLLNGNGWYIVEVVYLYLIFYILFRLIKKKDIALVLLCIATVAMIRYAFGLGHDYSDIGDIHFRGEWWYNSTIVFVMGIIFARFKNGIVLAVKKNYKIIAILTALLFIVSFMIEEKILVTHGYYRESYVGQRVSDAFITLVAQMVLCLFSTFLVLLINMKISIGNKAVKGLGAISTELFLIHQVFVSVIFSFSKVEPFFIYAVVLLCSIPSAIVLHYINKPLIYLFQDKSILRRFLTKRNKMMIVAIAVLSVIFATGYDFTVRSFLEYKSEIGFLKEVKEGETVEFGRYNTDTDSWGKERVSWIVLKKDNDTLLLISEKGLVGAAYNKKHEAVEWKESTLRSFLNDTLRDDLFSKYEKKLIIQEEKNGDYVSLLTEDEAKEYFSNDIERELEITDCAMKDGVNINIRSKVNQWDMKGYRSSWWWLKGDRKDYTAPIVTVDGDILTDKQEVNRVGGAIRPVIIVKL